MRLKGLTALTMKVTVFEMLYYVI